MLKNPEQERRHAQGVVDAIGNLMRLEAVITKAAVSGAKPTYRLAEQETRAIARVFRLATGREATETELELMTQS